MEERYKSKVVVDLFLERINKNNEREVLLLLRQNTGHADGMYDLPGGHVDKNEDLFDGMIREAKEEIGIYIKRENMKIVHIYHRYKKDSIKFVFSVSKYEDEIKNNELDKCKELRWFMIDELPDNIIPIIKDEIENIKDGCLYGYDK